ncbi:inhibitor of nuclear factor kappa-B kinase subunit beta isoform X2 [Scaptodrosophila lebanonensis]|uniref:IkappaB kinase n=1 Tax=Drosophila lebanonensis TaxID=7225 RepID=A0A6J2TDD7_DROLE|nr:inhibitor of nuclear factor kappa-B kinase subunit beta isoform X2 [Scaptodrosophila lebanonensis]
MPASLKNYGNWMILKKLGQGGFGEVLHWRNSQTGQEIATKRLKDGSSLSTDERCKLFDRWRQEYNWTRNLTEMPYIVRGIFLDDTDPAFMNYLNSNHGHDLPVIVMEYCNGGDVRRLLQQPENANGLSEFEVREILRSLRLALEYLHRRYSICHRDLKPDNIVLHRGDNGKRQYKLTDFGLARHNQNLKTLQQSVVGTIHYYAPEVVDTGRYNNKVDYWSMGIIAFELCCGRLPFIPHSSHFNIIVNVGKKPRECISISQDPDSTSESFIFHNELPKERHLTEVRAKKMTYWLRSALDAKYQTRGTFHNDDEKPVTDEVQTPAIFAELDKLLDCKVLTVFAACSYKCLAYEITPQLATISDLQHLIARDTGIAQESVVLLLPTGHPHKRITEQTRPADLFVDHWQDTSGRSRSSIPPVMIYVLDLNGTYNFPEPNLTPLMRLFMPPTAKRLETWMSKQLALEVNFLLSEEQRKFKMLLLSLRDHVLTLEDALLTFKPHIEALNAQKLKFMGAIDYFRALQNAGHEFFLKMLIF